MFGEKLIIGTAQGKIDGKGRIILPNFTYASPNDELILQVLDTEKETFLKLSLCKNYLELIKKFQELKEKATSIEEFEKYSREIEIICLKIACCVKIDDRRRFNIPNSIMKENNLLPGDDIFIKGAGTSTFILKKK